MNDTTIQVEFVKHAETLRALGMTLPDATAELVHRFSDCVKPSQATEWARQAYEFMDAHPTPCESDRIDHDALALYDSLIKLGWTPPK